jgi:hypothetical protein
MTDVRQEDKSLRKEPLENIGEIGIGTEDKILDKRAAESGQEEKY